MPQFCAVVKCSMRSERDQVRFFRIPAALKNRGDYLDSLSKQRRELWIKALKRGPLSESMLRNARICSRHFLSGQPAPIEDKNNPDWVPSQNMGYTIVQKKDEQSLKRHERSIERSEKRLKQDTIQSGASTSADSEMIFLQESAVDPSQEMDEDICSGVSVQTELNMDFLNGLFKDLAFCNEKIHNLQQKLEKTNLSEEYFANDDVKVAYFTGFPKSEMLFIIFSRVSHLLSTKSVLSPFQQFLLTLMKLRLNLPFKYLSYKFGISPATSSDIFYKCLDVLYYKFKNLVLWPDRELLRKQVPQCFRENFGNRVAVIIDCFEIFTETPSNLLNASRCWSNYKHHQTVKFLIGITPQGVISYISEAWGGRTSDKHLAENCGFLNLILPGDLILADRGFLIRDSVETIGAELQMPVFTKGLSQLHPSDLESTRNIATVRIHVERVIGLLKKKYKICQGPILMSMLVASKNGISALDKVLVVCSAFINLCASQIPMN